MQTGPYFYASKARRSNPGDLGSAIDCFAAELVESGYAEQSIENHVVSVAHFGGWLQLRNVAVEDIDAGVVTRFGKHRCSCPSRRRRRPVSGRDIGRIGRFIEYLCQQGVLSVLVEPEREGDADLVWTFGDWLDHHQGLSSATVDSRKHAMTQLLPHLGSDPECYDVATVRQVIRTVAQDCGIAKTKTLCNTLRSFLKYLVASGRCTPDLIDAVPTVPQWRLSSLPRYIAATEVEKVINVWTGSDRRSLRNRAILLLLARLGLRARDIVTLRTNDIDWQEATIDVVGKNRRPAKLPLPQDVGDALLGYLEAGRPRLAIPEIFLRVRAPHGPLRSSPAVWGIVDRSLTRAGIEHPPTRGTNLLRHSAATALLRFGATLDEVSTILRHRSIDMTAYYAKVDVGQIQKLTQPWPEGGPC